MATPTNRPQRASLQKQLALLVSITVLSIAPLAALAQTNDPEMEEIIIVGIRQSLESALDTKRNADSIVDSISSEGIGRFPDLNLGESLQRVTGVQIERGERRRAEIAIRGLPRKFALTRINGQAMASPDLRNAFAFGVFESSIFSNADVIKSPTAAMDDGGLSGTVNMRTLRPFDVEDNQLSISLGSGFETLNDEFSPNASVRGVHQFSDTFGASFAVGWSNQDFRRDVAAVTDYDPDGNDIQVADDFRFQANPTEGDRISAAATFEWLASDDLTFGFTGVYTDYDQLSQRDQIRFRNCADTAVDIVGDTAVESTHTGCRVEVETRERKDFDQTFALTLDATWEAGPWTTTGAIHFTQGEHDGNLIQMRRRINGAPGTVTVNTGSGDPEDFRIGLSGFDPGEVSTWSFTDPSVQTRFFPQGANNENEDSELAFQIDFTRELNAGIVESIQFGAKVRDRAQKSFDLGATSDDIDFSSLDDSIFRPSLVSSSGFFGGDLDAFGIVVPDVFATLDRILPITTTQPVNDEGFVLTQDLVDTFNTEQDIRSIYLMANLDMGDRLGVPVRGNVGLRYVETDRTTETAQDLDGTISNISVPFDFDNVLPSLNLVFELREDLLLRTSYSETIVRPNPSDFQAGTEIDVGLNSVDVEFNNPELEPFEAQSIDVSLEWYNRAGSALALAYFHKNIESQTVDRIFCPTSLADFSRSDAFAGLVTGSLNGDIDDCRDDADVSFTITDVINSSESFSIQGIELSATQNFDFLTGWARNLGFQANYTYIDADESGVIDDDGNVAPIEEVSEHTFNLIGYYETENWGVRLAHNYRSEFFTDASRGTSGGNRTVEDRHQLDASISYNITPQLSLGFEALNINNARVYEYEANDNRLRNYSHDERTFVLTSTYRFR